MRTEEGLTPAACLIGAGRVGLALRQAAQDRGVVLPLLGRGGEWPELEAPAGTPVVVCVRNDDLDAVVARVPLHRRADLVFIQNGALTGFLRERGLDACTRGLLYAAVARRGDPIRPGGVSPFSGPHAAACVHLWQRLDVPAREVGRDGFAAEELEKLLWLCVFGVLGERHHLPVGPLAEVHREDVRALCEELVPVAASAMGVNVSAAPLSDRLCAYSASIPEFPASLKEWRWRNGWLREQARRLRVATPRHEALLREAGVDPAA